MKIIMTDFLLRVNGIASYEIQQKLSKNLGYKIEKAFSRFLFFDYSDFNIPLNTTFHYLCEAQTNQYNCFCKVIMATQGWNVYYDKIPYGHKSICHVVFNESSYSLINSKIQIVNTWTTLKPDFTLRTAPDPAAHSMEITK